MATLFLDTSVVVRRYSSSEPGANRVRQACAPSQRHTLLLSRIAVLEVATALNRRVRDGSLPTLVRSRHWRAFQLHLRDQYQLIESTDPIYATAQQLVFQHPLRSLDSLHLASALAVSARIGQAALQFWTADEQQARAALSEGLMVELV